MDQNPIGRSSRSNPVTYVKAWDKIRQLYSDVDIAKVHGPSYLIMWMVAVARSARAKARYTSKCSSWPTSA